MPARDQRLAVEQALLGRIAYAVRAMAVLQALARDQAQAARLRGSHQRIDRMRMRGQKVSAVVTPWRCSSSRKNSATPAAWSGSEKRLVREGVALEPGQQAVGRRADDVGLRVMHMQVDEARRDQPARQMLDLQSGVMPDQIVKGSDRLDDACSPGPPGPGRTTSRPSDS